MSKVLPAVLPLYFSVILRTESEEMELIWGESYGDMNNFPNSELRNTAY